ncbi:translation initiation factor IF-2 [Phenylobacterium sp.]|uniref:translation initiation factor IF-2 n=1 Tax=Phenylobacterium sp. TaxID=1871053 RepID=UPI00272FE957|nr:translation initiation factor IF-2 [Phenylobacterium sp.]MDP1617615.1 translation initiation factor IF-2 [Phenylobacterium sp.]
MSDDKDNGRTPGGRPPLTLKPRGAGSVSAGTVKQSFSHGRSKPVDVETKRPRTHVPAPSNLAGPSSSERRGSDSRPAPRGSGDASGLSSEELRARQNAIERAREAALAAAEAKAREERARAEREAAAKAAAAQEQAAAQSAAAQTAAAKPAAEAPAAPAASAPADAAPAAAASTEAKSEPVKGAPAPASTPAQAAPAERPRAAAPRTDGPRNAGAGAGGGQTRSYTPSPDRRDDRASTTTYRPPRPRFDATSFNQRAPRQDRDTRAEAPPPAEQPREDRSTPRGERSAPAGGDTVRYSALTPRPAPPRDGPRGAGRPVAPGAPPATPEVQRAARQAPRPGAANLDRRPEEEDDRRGKPPAPGKAISRGKGAPQRREGRLTIQALAAGDEGAVERMRSLASVRRAREREREKRKGGGQEAARVAREVIIPDVITVGELANRMTTRGVEVIKFLMRQGVMMKINDVIDSDTAELVATEFGHTVKRVSESDVETGFLSTDSDDSDAPLRSPVVAVMGHVDHGKTSLLDALRSADVASGEHGGITQHIGAYQVRLEDGNRVTFLDTPGHAAFSAMRARGANVTDIVILVVAADDGVMPQTIEAIQHAKASGAPIIVAINKIDKPDADPNRVINELLQHEIVVERLGGETQVVEVSALEKLGLDDLLEAILIQAEVMELRADPDRTAEGVVIEAKLDRGRGAVSTVLVKRGSLKRGDIVVAGANWGRVRALFNERDEQLDVAGPSTPVEILGLDGTPEPGEPLAVVENEARAREITEYRQRVKREKSGSPVAGASLADMMAKLADKKVSELPVIVKADVQGSAEAIVGSLDKISTDEVRARIILSGAGAISESDVMLAKGAGSPILGFNGRAAKQARDLAEREGVEIRYYSIIYDLIDDIKGVLSGMLAPIQRETFLGNAEVLQAFDISKVGRVAGCRVTEGVVRKGARVRIIRNDVVVLELGVLQTLKRFKDEVNEVPNGQECGMAFQGFQDIKAGDTIECFNLEEVKRYL